MKVKVALIAGGDSGEYEVSLSSAESVKGHLDKDKYDVFFIHMKGLDWHFIDDEGNKITVDKNDFSVTIENEKIAFDVAFILIHGTPGEDGKLQGYFDMLGLPYTSCDLFTSALTFKKNFTKHVAKTLGVSVAKTLFYGVDSKWDAEKIVDAVGLPCFVKPNKGGSSVGISKVNSITDIDAAIKIAFAEDDEILIEEFLDGTELGCGVYKTNGKIISLPVTEIVSKTEFFDYEAKYKGLSDEITPARITDENTKECQQLSEYLYNEFNCRGVVRFDYIFCDETLYFLEVNTVPGLSAASIIPQQIREAGLTEAQVYDELLVEALK
ncbi:MAG: D-alanine--D-alanine ligase [Bacteroidota bacterium]|nr:D-alanine--D-alanine ligase [Bacteroidota bacterium]